MFLNYGTNRVLEPVNVLPISAWRLNNSKEIYNNELLIGIKRLHIETTNFKQICIECSNDTEKIKEKILDIVIKRGKLHNPITDTGGIVFGTIEKMGEKYHNKKGLAIGDEVICNTSLATIPLYISKIISIDFALGQVEAEGYAIIFNNCPIVKKPEGVPVNLVLFSFDESGSLFSVSKLSKNKKNFLVVGSGMMTSLLYGRAIRKATGKNARITCVLDHRTEFIFKGKEVEDLLLETFNEILYLNILRPVECLEKMNLKDLVDLSVNCADIPGAETINVLATKPKGTVYFSNLINNYNIALYVTEAIPREVEIRCADGFVQDYDDFSIQIVREIAESLESVINNPSRDNAVTLHRNKLYHDTKNMTDDFVCESRVMSIVLDEVLGVSKYDCNVLIIGETGVGKEKIASIIHKNSNRKMQPFVKINCASVAETLLESEFFGYEKGAFTGANLTGKKGYFEIADNGIIFLDEIGELSLDLQAKLLRVIQDGEFYKIGGVKPVKTNVRILSATNKNLEKMMERKRFRQDLYYRLNVFPIRIPPLTERKTEIPALVESFAAKYNEKFGMNKVVVFDALQYLQEYDWPGNIRELENMVQRLLINTKKDRIETFDVMREVHNNLFNKLAADELDHLETSTPIYLERMVDNYEKEIIKFAHNKYQSSRKAANALCISQTQFIRKKNKYGID